MVDKEYFYDALSEEPLYQWRDEPRVGEVFEPTSVITFGEYGSIRIRGKENRRFLKTVFSTPLGQPISETDVVEAVWNENPPTNRVFFTARARTLFPKTKRLNAKLEAKRIPYRLVRQSSWKKGQQPEAFYIVNKIEESATLVIFPSGQRDGHGDD